MTGLIIQIHATRESVTGFVDKSTKWEVREENNNPEVLYEVVVLGTVLQRR